MHEYEAKVLQIISGNFLLLDINLGFDVHINKYTTLNKIVVPNCNSKDVEEKNRGMAAKQKLSDLIDKADGKIVRIKTEIDEDDILVMIYIGGMNVNKTLIAEGFASGKGF